MLIYVSLLDPLVLGSSVLEPDLNLSLCQSEGLCELEPATPGDVLCPLELQLQPQGLLAGKRGALSSRPSFFSSPPCHWNEMNVIHVF